MSQLLLTGGGGLPSGLGNKGNRVQRKRKRIEVKDCVPISSFSACVSKKTTDAGQSKQKPHDETTFLPVHDKDSADAASAITSAQLPEASFPASTSLSDMSQYMYMYLPYFTNPYRNESTKVRIPRNTVAQQKNFFLKNYSHT